jgi:hypothetical protein
VPSGKVPKKDSIPKGVPSQYGVFGDKLLKIRILSKSNIPFWNTARLRGKANPSRRLWPPSLN